MAARRSDRSGPPIEWQTLLVLLACYGTWGAVTYFHEQIGLWLMIPIAVYSVALHSSLQHEALHGHPTRRRFVNELLVFATLGLFVPYRRFRATHLRHHCNERLTDPYDDPESWFLAETDWERLSGSMRVLLSFNATLAGRLVLGPALAAIGLWRNDFRELRAGNMSVARAYILHGLGIAIVLGWVVGVCGLNPLVYALLVCYPAMSCLMLRTYAEHRAHENPTSRSAIIEATPFFALLFLNNNLHHVHHSSPRTPWYELPGLYRAGKQRFVSENGGYGFDGYGALFRRHFLRPVNAIVHPFLYRKEQT
ncbi:MAG: fatty acid desaturase [Hyphomicrobiaceae bacterium]